MNNEGPKAAEPVLRVEGLTKSYLFASEEVAATQDVSFEVNSGEMVLIMGPSGSGKTTLLLMCGGLLQASAGRVWIAGTEITSLSERKLPELRLTSIGFVFQMANLLANLTAAENVRILLEAAGWKRERAQRRAVHLLKGLGLEHRADHLPAHLSGGERQRVAIARALANRPPLILADEPTGALDSRNGAAVMTTLRELADTGATSVLCVTHDPRVVGLADRVLWLEDGHLTTGGPSMQMPTAPAG